jgi:hypothetical protein
VCRLTAGSAAGRQVEGAFAHNYSMVPPYHEGYWIGLAWNQSALPGPRYSWTDR